LKKLWRILFPAPNTIKQGGHKGPYTSLRSTAFARRTKRVRLRSAVFARLVSGTFLTALEKLIPKTELTRTLK
jgi:hypothetical protein